MTYPHLRAILLRTSLAFIMLSACSQESVPPEYVFIPDDNFSTSVEIVVPTDALAGEWIPVSAKRWSGPWKRVIRKEVPPDKLWFKSQPPGFQPEVAENLAW